jgi:Telomere resolvase
MTLDVISESYAAQYTAAVAMLDSAIAHSRSTEQDMLKNAKTKLVAFHTMNLANKDAVQRRLKSSPYSGHAMVDDLITSFTIFPEYINDLKVSVTERTALQKNATAALEAKSIESITVQASELISKCKATLRDTRANPFDTAAALALITGRRTVEIFKTAAFTPASEHSVMFCGQAKKGDLLEAIAYEIPVLAPHDLINSALVRLRAAKDCTELTNRDVNLRYASSSNSGARRLLGKEHHFHTLRAVYAAVVYNCCLPHKYSLNAFVARVLGHATLGSSLNYCNIHVEGLKKRHKFAWAAIA